MHPFELLLAAFASAKAAAPPVSVERIDDTSFRMTVAVPEGSGISSLQSRLLPAARLACRNKSPVLARYRTIVPNDEAAPKAVASAATLDQELICIDDTSRRVPAAVSPDPDWAPSPADQQALLAATYRYFAAKDAGRYEDAYSFLSDRMKAAAPLADWSRSARDFNAEAGRATGRRVVEISWYNHPSDAPEPGIYVAADFSAEFEKLEFVCGYAMWRLLPDGSFRLAREEQNLARKRGSRPMAAIDRDPMRVRLGCKD